MRRLDRNHLLTITLVLILAAVFFRPHFNRPLTASATGVSLPCATPKLPELPSIEGGLGGIGFQANLAEGTYEYVIDPPPTKNSSPIGLRKTGPRLNIRLAP